MDSVGQRALSAVVDLAFFISITLLGLHGAIRESSLILVLSIYATGRFSVAQSKQQMAQAALMTGNYPPGNGPSGSGTSGMMRAVVPEARPAPRGPTGSPPRPPRRDERVDERVRLSDRMHAFVRAALAWHLPRVLLALAGIIVLVARP